MAAPAARIDRAGAVRRALVELVAERGFHGASMAEVAGRARVAQGTAYVHYASKDALVLAAYAEVKEDLAEAALTGDDPAASPAERFAAMWRRVHEHLAGNRAAAAFLTQVEMSPYARDAPAVATGPWSAALESVIHEPSMAAVLAPLPPVLLFELGLGPAARLAASGDDTLDAAALDVLVQACWRAITRP